MNIQRKPEWLKINLEQDNNYSSVRKIIENQHLHTICSSGKCPNRNQCWSMGTATFMILGDICTRSCKFCATKSGRPLPLDKEEPLKVAESIAQMQLKHAVITSVDRDDLPDKGAAHWAETVQQIKRLNPNVIIELLIPDYEEKCLNVVLNAQPDIVGHNLETVERLTETIRSKATYRNSLQVLENIAKKGFITKTGIMVGLGETQEEVETLLYEVRNVGCSMITIGQYLQPNLKLHPVIQYVHPDVFQHYKEYGKTLGYSSIESSPLVRSSYMAERSFFDTIKNYKKSNVQNK
jgi:lipoic acid synthetase